MMLATKPDATALRKHSGYANWRPAITGVTVLALVGVDNLVLPCLMGGLVLPTGAVEDGQSPQHAAQLVLSGMPGDLPIQRRVAVDEEHTRRRKIISHLVVTAPLTVEEAQCLVYRDPRADTDVLRTTEAVSLLTEPARARALLGLQALAINAMVYNHNGAIEHLESVPAP
ncbi:hypothetical protein OG758_48595 [Streptomyces sp. NBC_01474]|uniref:hypothetical protein n=1 Tax=Streptomyces sp. NBC_01474 TaxID=2903880 RepID=UPI002DD8C079|nr:hypothetical protein [Streptomyces sp. NBC_01474]WSD92790.1 hypothetical protein OG758_00195 [Streptomyces sp. NBC_01474]WSE01265.1 hypothetical protein OG758_48595 [Streptomyces sp. NBC_01474]